MGFFTLKSTIKLLPCDFIAVLDTHGLSQVFIHAEEHDVPQAPHPNFKHLCKKLKPIFKQALIQAKVKSRELTQALCEYIYFQLAHHTMKRLLTNPLLEVSIHFNQLKSGSKDASYALPEYKKSDIAAFLEKSQSKNRRATLFSPSKNSLSLEPYISKAVEEALAKPFDINAFLLRCIEAYRAIEDISLGKECGFLPYELSIEKPTIFEGPDEDGFYTVIIT